MEKELGLNLRHLHPECIKCHADPYFNVNSIFASIYDFSGFFKQQHKMRKSYNISKMFNDVFLEFCLFFVSNFLLKMFANLSFIYIETNLKPRFVFNFFL